MSNFSLHSQFASIHKPSISNLLHHAIFSTEPRLGPIGNASISFQASLETKISFTHLRITFFIYSNNILYSMKFNHID